MTQTGKAKDIWLLLGRNVIAYLTVGLLSYLSLPYTRGMTEAIGGWYTYGATLGFFIIWGPAALPGVLVGNAVSASLDTTTLGVALGFALTRTASAGLGAFLVRQSQEEDFILGTFNKVMRFGLLAGFLAPLFLLPTTIILDTMLETKGMSPSVAVLAGLGEFSACAASAVSFAPILICLAAPGKKIHSERGGELVFWVALEILIGILGNTNLILRGHESSFLSVLALPVHVMATIRMGTFGAASVFLVGAVFNVHGAMTGKSPLNYPSVVEGTLIMQGSIWVVNLTLLGLGAMVRERSNILEALRESLDNFQSLFNATFEGLIVHKDGIVQNVNEAFLEISGYAWHEVIGNPILEFVAPEFEPLVLQRFVDRSTESYEIQLLKKGGDRVWVEIAGQDFLMEGQAARVITIWNLSRRKENESRLKEQAEQLQQKEKMEAVGRLAGGIAHDFNNLLVGIQGFAELLKLRTAEQPGLTKLVDAILRSSDRAADLTQHLLAFSRKNPTTRQLVDLHQVLEAIAGLCDHVLDKRVQISISKLASHAVVSGDPALLESMILNLAINAGDAMPDGGMLRIGTIERELNEPLKVGDQILRPGIYLVLSVEDTGSGMDSETLDRCFEPFYTTKPVGKGTGLGLATVYGTATAHGGSIRIDSTLGKGTLFEVYLPLTLVTAPAPETLVNETPKSGQGRLMVVDDEEAIRLLLVESMGGLGYEPEAFESGEVALQALKAGAGPFDIAIVDMIMPGMGGKEFLVELRKLYPSLPVLVCTGFSTESLDLDDQGLGPLQVLPKPFRLKDLAERLRDLLKK